MPPRTTEIFFNATPPAGSIWNSADICKPTDRYQSSTADYPNNSAVLKEHWTLHKLDTDIVMLWAAASLCFFGFFKLGEITIPSLTVFDSSRHLA